MDEEKIDVDLVRNLVEVALGKSLKDVRKATDKTYEILFEGSTKVIEVLWVKNSEDPVYIFWKAVKHKVLDDTAYIIFTGIDKDHTSWKDLDVYEGGMFGSLYLMVYDNKTNAGIKPSQRGLFNREV